MEQQKDKKGEVNKKMSNTKLTSKDETEYFELRQEGLTHETAMKVLMGEMPVIRSEWSPEQIEVSR